MTDTLQIIVESDEKRAVMYLRGRLSIESSPELAGQGCRAVLHPARQHRIADLPRRRQHRHRLRGRPLLLFQPDVTCAAGPGKSSNDSICTDRPGESSVHWLRIPSAAPPGPSITRWNQPPPGDSLPDDAGRESTGERRSLAKSLRARSLI